MQKRPSKRQDTNIISSSIVNQVTDEAHIVKNPAIVAIGRLGDPKGGRVRSEKPTSVRRVEIAKKAALARWGK